MDYKETVQLPHTDFPMKANLAQREVEILKQWEKSQIYKQIQEGRKNAEQYVFHDGPPNANGPMHMGTALNRILKDIIVKSKTMMGYRVPFTPGWDCLGMQIEYEITKELKQVPINRDCLQPPNDLTPKEIRERCKKFAEKYIEIQRQEFKRIGEFGDWEHPYITMSPDYEAKVIDVFKTLVSKGFIYRAKRPVHWCSKCKTALAEAELEYKEISSPSIYVRFKVVSTAQAKAWDYQFPTTEDRATARVAPTESNLSILIWTTTPWTLPANVACALNPNFKYDFVRIGNETLIIADALKDAVIEKLKIKDYKEVQPQIEKSLSGKELEGMIYKHPIFDKECKVVLSDEFVSKESGTGCVHIAPGHGYEDYQVGLEYDLPLVSPVDELGRFTDEGGEFKGKYVFDADKYIIESLKKKGLLLYEEELAHSYPCCWRCKAPLIFRATSQWFLKVDHNNLREQCIKEIDKVCWIPGWSKDRLLHNVRERPDWCLSRQRSWGIPIPALYCKNCDEAILDLKLIEKAKEVIKKEGSNGWFNLGDLDGFLCPKCGGKEFKKEENIFDVWFDSSSSWTVMRDKGLFPSDLYCEGVDQHRGWFQHSLWLSLIVEGKSCFKSVLTHGLVLDKEMRKMSKSLGNIVSPMSIVDKYGADILRLYFASLDYTSDLPFDPDTLESIVIAYRKIRNTFKFSLGNLYDFKQGDTPCLKSKSKNQISKFPKERNEIASPLARNDKNDEEVEYHQLLELDKLMLHRLTLLIMKVKDAYEKFEYYKVYRNIYDYCVVDLSKFYFDILKDRLYTYGKTSLDRRSAQTVLYETLLSLTKLIAPLIPFTAEEVWQYVKGEHMGSHLPSIHLELMPEPNPQWIDDKLLSDYELMEEVRDDVLIGIEEARKSKLIGNSLEAKVVIWTEDKDLREFLHLKLSLLPSIFIVSQVSIDKVADMLTLRRVAIKIEPAEGSRCERCWIRSIEVGKHSDYPTLCSKCATVLREGDYG